MPERPARAVASSLSSGPGRVLIAVYAVFAVAATGRSSVQLAEQVTPAYLLSAAAALIYLAATVALARGGPTWRAVAWAACGIELAGVLVIGALSRVAPTWFEDGTVWAGFGAGYAYVPLVLPFAGLAWLVHTRGRPAP